MGGDVRVLVDRYELREPIGAGATGRVYAALDTRLGRLVAVKTLHPSLAHDQAFLSRFHREVSIAGKLNHANIVHVYDWGTDGGVPFLVTELLPGGSLAAFLERGGRLEVSQAAALGYQVARALDYAHAQGVIHRDVKPANLLFDEHGAIRIADFGLARALADATPTLPSEAVFGTLRYASPEQARADALDGRTDLYSLALVLVESVTGVVPFAAESPAQMLWARTSQPIPAPFELGLLRPVVELRRPTRPRRPLRQRRGHGPRPGGRDAGAAGRRGAARGGRRAGRRRRPAPDRGGPDRPRERTHPAGPAPRRTGVAGPARPPPPPADRRAVRPGDPTDERAGRPARVRWARRARPRAGAVALGLGAARC